RLVSRRHVSEEQNEKALLAMRLPHEAELGNDHAEPTSTSSRRSGACCAAATACRFRPRPCGRRAAPLCAATGSLLLVVTAVGAASEARMKASWRGARW